MRTLLGVVWLACALPLAALPPEPGSPAPLPGATNVIEKPILRWSGSDNLLANGGFEQGLTGWAVEIRPVGAGRITANPSFQSQIQGVKPVTPTEGTQLAYLNLLEPGSGSLSREFMIPEGAGSVRLVFSEWLSAASFSSLPDLQFRGAYGVDLFEAGAPATHPLVLQSLRPRISHQNHLQTWTRRVVDVSRFAGRNVRLSVWARLESGRFQVGLDDVRLEVSPESGPEHEIRLGEQPNLGPGDVLALTRDTVVAAPPLRPNTTNYWQVLSRDPSGTTPGPVWSFVTGPVGPAQALTWDNPIQPVVAGVPMAVGLTVRDALGHAVADAAGTARVIGKAVDTRVPNVLFSELTFGSTSGQGASVEIANVGTNTVNVAGWKISVYDEARWPEPVGTATLPPNASLLAGRTATLRSGGSPGGTFPNLNLGKALLWSPRPTNQLAAAVLQDAEGAIVDVIAVGGADPAAIVRPTPIPLWHWSSPSLPGFTNTTALQESWQRVAARDTHSAEDWAKTSQTAGSPHRNLFRPMLPSTSGVEVNPSSIPLEGGRGSALLTVPTGAGRVELVAFTTNGLTGSLWLAPAQESPIRIELPERLSESAGTVSGGGRIRLPAAVAADLVVQLSSSAPDELVVPPSVTIPAGQAEAIFDLTPVNDGLRDGTVVVRVTAAAAGHVPVPTEVSVDDAQTAVLGLEFPASAREGGPSPACWVTITPPPERDASVRVIARFADAPPFETVVVVPAGSTRAPFRISIPPNDWLDGAREIPVQATVVHWTEATGTLSVLDDDLATLALTLPKFVTEAGMVLPQAGRVTLGALVRENTTVQFVSSRPGRVQLPAQVVVPAGQRSAAFDITLADNFEPDGNEAVSIQAVAPGFTDGVGSIQVLDNDAAAFRFGTVLSPQPATWIFNVVVQALGSDGEPVPQFAGPLTLSCIGPNGPVPVTLDRLNLCCGGSAEGYLSVDAVGTGFRLRAEDGHGHWGESELFDVVEPAYRDFRGTTMDLAWDARSQRLYVSQMGGTADGLGGRVVAFDPVARRETGAATVETILQRLVLSEGGEYLYGVGTSGNEILQFSLPGLELVRRWSVVREDNSAADVEDLAVMPGQPDVVAVVRSNRSVVPSAESVEIYDHGVRREKRLDAATRRVNRLEFAPDGTLYGLENETSATAFSRMRVDAEGVTLLDARESVTRSIPKLDFALFGSDVLMGDGQVYTPGTGASRTMNWGDVNFAFAGEAPRQRAYVLAGFGFDSRVRTYEFHTGELLGETILPGLSAQWQTPDRLVRWGDDGLAAVVSQRMVYWRSDLVPSPDVVDLEVSGLTLDTPVVGNVATATLRLGNLSAHVAPKVEVRLTWEGVPVAGAVLRAGDTVIPATPSAQGLSASLGSLAAGTTRELQLELNLQQAGPLHLTVRASANAPELDWANNTRSTSTFVETRLARRSSALLAEAVDSLAGDPARSRLYAGQGSRSRVIALDPLTGRTLLSTPVDLPPPVDLLTVSSDGARLYAASTEGSRVVVLETETLGVLRTLDLGNFRPLDLAVHPVQRDTLAVSVINPFTGNTQGGVQLFDAAVPRGQRAEFNLSRIAFNQTGTYLYGIQPNATPVGWRLRPVSYGLGEAQPIDRWADASIRGVQVADGRVYLSDIVFADDFSMTVVGRIPGSGLGEAGVIAPEVRLGFSLQRLGTSGAMEVFDLERGTSVSRIPVPALEEPRGLVRWGPDGLAWIGRSTVALLRTDWLPQGSATTGLGVQIDAIRLPQGPQDVAEIAVQVENRGPSAAPDVQLNWNLPPTLMAEWPAHTELAPDPGTGFQDQRLGTLAVGEKRNFVVKLRPNDLIKIHPLAVRVRGDIGEFEPTDQQGLMVIHWTSPGQNLQLIPMPTLVNHAVWHPKLRRFFLSLGPGQGLQASPVGNTVITYDPATGQFGYPYFRGTLPNRLTLMPDGGVLLVALDGTSEVSVCIADGLSESRRFPLGSSPGSPLLRTVRDLLVHPDEPRLYVATLVDGLGELPNAPATLASYFNGFLNPSAIAGVAPYGLEPAGNEPSFWTVLKNQANEQLLRVESTPSGLKPVPVSADFTGPIGDLSRGGDGLLAADGTVLNASTGATVGHLPSFPTLPSLVQVEADGSRGYVMQTQLSVFVQGYDLGSRTLVGTQDLPIGPLASARALQRWGVDGLAFVSDQGLWLFRSPVVPTSDTADWDGDRMSDRWEQANGTDPHRDDTAGDLDGDGMSNGDEWVAGTAANDPTSRLGFRLAPRDGGGWQGEFHAQAGRTYRLQSSPSLEGPWTMVGSPIPGQGNGVALPLPDDPGPRLFRVILDIPE